MKCKCENEMVKNGLVKGRQRWRCKACGRTFQEDRMFKRLEEEDVEEIIRGRANGTTIVALAAMKEVTWQAINYRLKKKK